MLETILPATVAVSEAFTDDPECDVFPGEEDLIARAVPARRREFITARRCARLALGVWGYPPRPIRPGPGREPQWPAGIVGSITHCPGYRAAATADAFEWAAIGIDAEPHDPLPTDVLKAISTESERTDLLRFSKSRPGIHWDRLLFSTKEALYKTCYPFAGLHLGFADTRVHVDPASETFIGKFRIGSPGSDRLSIDVRGRYLIDADLIMTTIALPASG